MATSPNNVWKQWYPRIKSQMNRWLRIAGGVTTRFILVLVVLVIAAWLSYQNVWRPLQEEITLPAGVLETDPLLKSDLLQQINAERVQRAQYQPKSYVGFSRLFSSEASPTPAPSL